MSLLSNVHPPACNTGGDCPNRIVECGIDYLRGTVPIRYSMDIRTLISKCFDLDLNLVKDRNGQPLGTGFYKLRFTSEHGINVMALNRSIDDSSTDQHCLIDIPGKSLARIDTQAQADFFLELAFLEFNCTRIDIKADDYSKTITPQLAMIASQDGNKTGFRRFSYQQDDRGAGTFYAGLRGRNGGGKFVRIYDKWLQSDGEIDAVRIELEASSAKAVDIFCSLTTLEISHWPDFIRGVFDAALSFKDRTEQKKACRAKMLSWWSWFVDGSVVFSFSRIVKQSVFEKTRNWIKNQVVASLAMLVCGESGDFFLRDSKQMWSTIYPLIIEGLDHMGERHQNLVRQYWRDNDMLDSCYPSLAR